jgi:putative ABC transport system permease protein
VQFPAPSANAALLEIGVRTSLDRPGLANGQPRDPSNHHMLKWLSLDRSIQDVRYGLRTLRNSPGFTMVALTMLALGIGANTAIFSLASAVLLRPLPFPEPDRLVLIWDDFSARRGPARVEPTPADYVGWKERSRSFVDMAAFVPDTYNLTGAGDPDKLAGVRTTGNLFTVLRMQPLLGRTLSLDDERADASPAVVINARLWRSRFGGDPSIVGRAITLNGLAHVVVGVLPADFEFPNKDAALWVPARFTPQELAQQSTYSYYVVARLAPAVALAEARAEMTAVGRQLAKESPRTNDGVAVSVTPLHADLTRDAKPAISLLVGAVGLVLLIACANLTNLLLARGASRRKELAVRKALGAGGWRVARQLLTESAVLAAAGSALGAALSTVAFRYLTRLVPSGLPEGRVPALDWRVLVFTAAVAALMVLAFGAGPAFAAARVDPDAALRSGTSRGTTAAGRRVRGALVVAEMMLTAVLLVAAGLLLRSYANVLAVEPGFDPRGVLIAETVLPPSKYRTFESRSGFYTRVVERVSALPAVAAAAYVNYPPLVFKGGRAYVSIEGRPTPSREDFIRHIVSDRVVGDGYFGALGVPLVRGRLFDARDGVGAPLAVIINQKMAAMHWPNEDPVGRRVRIGAGGANPWFTIVGVVGNMRQVGLDVPPEPEMYLSLGQPGLSSPFAWPQYLVVRTKGDPLTLAASVRRAVWDVDPDEPVANIHSMDQVIDVELVNRNTQLTLIAAFAALALFMAAIGLYGVLSYAVAQRMPEIAIRMALGAPRSTVVLQVVRDALTLASCGIALGLAAAFVLTRLIASWLFSISPGDPATFAATVLVLAATTVLASFVPAFRGASVDASSVLRAE